MSLSDINIFSSKVLQGNLDNLVMMAIRKEADRRYKNVDELISDVNNYLQSRQLLLAKELYRQSVELRIQLDSNNKIRVATAQSNFARVLAKLNQHTESAALVQQGDARLCRE